VSIGVLLLVLAAPTPAATAAKTATIVAVKTARMVLLLRLMVRLGVEGRGWLRCEYRLWRELGGYGRCRGRFRPYPRAVFVAAVVAVASA
jgi:hypothetical protein